MAVRKGAMRRLLDTRGAADFLTVGEATLRSWRVKRQGPRYLRLGGLVRYDVADLELWLDAQAVDAEDQHSQRRYAR